MPMKTMIYEVPEVAPSEAAETMPMAYAPRFYVPASKEMVDKLELGMTIDIRVKGKVRSLDQRDEASQENKYEFELEVKQVSLDESNEFTELAEDD